jgi:hypothetical protein
MNEKSATGGKVVTKGPDPAGMGYNNILNCDDEEDCIAGSGSGDGPTNPQFPATGSEANGADGRIEVWYPEGTDSKCRSLLFLLSQLGSMLQTFCTLLCSVQVELSISM